MNFLFKLFRIVIFTTVIVANMSHARSTKKLTPFQKTIQDCLADKIEVKNLTTLRQLYNLIDQKFLLISSSVIEREVLYKDKDELKKLKFQNGQVSLYKVMVDDDDVLQPLRNDVRQKSLTVESYMSQLLVHANIRSDWMKTQESRSGKTNVVMVQADQEITSLVIEKADTHQKLECSHQDSSDVCSCLSLK